MSDLERPNSTLSPEPNGRASGHRFGDLGERLARTFGGFDRTRAELPEWETEVEPEYPAPGAFEPEWEPRAGIFPYSPHGYDPAVVEQRIRELEHELATLKARKAPTDAVAEEITRIGEQTSSILLLAYEQAHQLKREAREQADRTLADAAASAVKLSDDAKRRLADLDTETDTVWQERARLLEDARTVGTALISLVEQAAERFPAELEKVTAPELVAGPPVDPERVAAPLVDPQLLEPQPLEPEALAPQYLAPAEAMPREEPPPHVPDPHDVGTAEWAGPWARPGTVPAHDHED